MGRQRNQKPKAILKIKKVGGFPGLDSEAFCFIYKVMVISKVGCYQRIDTYISMGQNGQIRNKSTQIQSI